MLRIPAALLVAAAAAAAFLNLFRAPSGCRMSYSYPSYTRVELPESLRAGHAYTLYAYRETHGAGAHSAAPYTGVPVLFLPGSAGSYRQARSLASETAKQHAAAPHGPVLEWFTADFAEELSLDGTLLQRQVLFTLNAVLHLRDLYSVARAGGSPPVLLVGHSMGGVVARAAAVACPPGLVGAVIALAAPHRGSPLLSQVSLAVALHRMDTAWHQQQAGPAPLPLASIDGGPRDLLVPESTAALNLPHTVAVSALDTPGVRLSMGHQCVLWCHQVVALVSRMMLHLAASPEPHAVMRRFMLPHGEPLQQTWPLARIAAYLSVSGSAYLPVLCATSAASARQESTRSGPASWHPTALLAPQRRAYTLAAMSAGLAMLYTEPHRALAHTASLFTMCSISDAVVSKQLQLIARCARNPGSYSGRDAAALSSVLLPVCVALVLLAARAPPVVGWAVGVVGQSRSVAAQRSGTSPALLALLLWNTLLACPQAAAWLHVLAHEHRSLLPFSPIDSLLAAFVAAFGSRQLVKGPVCQVPPRWWLALHASCMLGVASGCFWVIPTASALACFGAILANFKQ